MHAAIYRRSHGRIGARVGGLPVLLLTTTGRRSGRPRTTPVQYRRCGDQLLVVAAAGGSPRPPAWWFNLSAEPRVEVQLGDRSEAYVARTAEGDEREELWRFLVDGNRWLPGVEHKARRRLPVVVLAPDTVAGGR
jgi:deazaflavin-dependent oxidoreductase (nitroreductase family)